MINMLALDLDGTLLRNDGVISKNTISILQKLHDNGIIIVIATGRSFVGLPQNISNLDFFDYLISSNGTSIKEWGTETIIYREWLSNNLASSIYRECKELNIIVDSLVKGVWHIDNCSYEKNKTIFAPEIKKYIENTRVKEIDYLKFIQSMECGIEKMVINYSPIEDIIKKRISNLEMCYPVQVWTDKTHKLDIISKQASKGNALAWLAEYLGIEINNVMAFGNDDNDISMFEIVGYPISVSNSTNSLKSVAKYVTSSNNQDGVYNFLRIFFQAGEK